MARDDRQDTDKVIQSFVECSDSYKQMTRMDICLCQRQGSVSSEGCCSKSFRGPLSPAFPSGCQPFFLYILCERDGKVERLMSPLSPSPPRPSTLS